MRLFVGGLPPGLTPEELRARFTPFGEVLDCRIAPPKVYGGGASSKGAGTPPATFPRDFGHVELLPKDEAALRKCISAYNGCRWRGGVLRCAPARPDYAQRLARERGGAAGDEVRRARCV